MNIIELQQSMSKVLKPKRYVHVLGVQYTAASLAMVYGVDIYKAQVAGLLHDCAKYLSDEEMFQECENHRIDVTEGEKIATQTLHAPVGAYLAQSIYGITDLDIINAIRYHTIGRPNMSMLEKIIYIADYIEPSRPADIIPNLDKIRKLAFTNIDKAVVESIENTIFYVQSKNQLLNENTYDTLNYYKTLV